MPSELPFDFWQSKPALYTPKAVDTVHIIGSFVRTLHVLQLLLVDSIFDLVPTASLIC